MGELSPKALFIAVVIFIALYFEGKHFLNNYFNYSSISSGLIWTALFIQGCIGVVALNIGLGFEDSI